MAYPRYFEPDPQIPDAELLGYGDLVYDDGSRQFVNGDPEVASQFEIKSAQPPVQGPPPDQVPVPDFMQQQAPPLIGADRKQYTTDLLDPQNPIKPFEGVQDPQTGELLDPGMPGTDPVQALGGLANVVRGTVGSGPLANAGPEENRAALGMGSYAPAPQAQQGPPAPQPFPGANNQLFKADIKDPENPIKPLTPQELQIYQREGALPPDVAARQQGELSAMNQQTLDVEEQSRGEQSRIMNEATLKAMAKNEADRIKQQEDIEEQQAKMERLDKERQQVKEMKIDESLSGAIGLGGGLMAVLGSALLGSTGSDAGLRMIDSTIDRHVREQVRQKETSLGILAEQIGSTQQAIKIGKAELYKTLADKAELTVQKTKNDLYEAQSPAIIQGLRQKQLEYTQKWEQDSLGKTTERMPVAPKPPNPEALQKYGELRRSRDAGSDVIKRIELQANLHWTPGKDGQPGFYANKDEVIKKGIEGVGAIEQWVPDFVYSSMGRKDGYEVRGAKQALAYAAIRQMQPTGIISDMDRKVGELASTMDTEQGLIHTLERLRNGEETQKQNDAAQYTPQVVAEYERQYRSSGGQQQGNPGAARPAAMGDIQAERQRRAQPAGAQPEARGPGNLPPPTPEEFRSSVQGFAEGANLNPDAVLRVIGKESGGKGNAVNSTTGKHGGLIQFSRETWDGLAKEAGEPDLTWEDMTKMSAEEQLPFVMAYYNRLGLGPDNDAGDYGIATFMPAFWQKPDDFVLGQRGSTASIGGLSMGKVWAQNPGLRDGDLITVGSVRRAYGG